MHDPAHALPRDWSALIAPPAKGHAPPLRTVVAVAHPDDETIAIGAALPHLRTATFVYATDGAPRRLGDIRLARSALAALGLPRGEARVASGGDA